MTGDEHFESHAHIADALARHPAVTQVDAYWHALSENGDVPARNAIDPRALEGALPYTFVAERIAHGMARIRVAGAHLNDVMGMEIRGMPLSTLI